MGEYTFYTFIFCRTLTSYTQNGVQILTETTVITDQDVSLSTVAYEYGVSRQLGQRPSLRTRARKERAVRSFSMISGPPSSLLLSVVSIDS